MPTDQNVASTDPDRPRAGGIENRRAHRDAGVVLVAYSEGTGGGVERYVTTVETALGGGDEPYVRLNLHDGTSARRLFDDRRLPGLVRRQWAAHSGLFRQLKQHTAGADAGRLVVTYLNLLPTALLATRDHPGIGITVVVHGNEIWAPGLARRLVRRLLTRPRVRAVAVSGFSAGALYPVAPAGVLAPGLSVEWFDTLVAAERVRPPRQSSIRIVTSFRLESWRDKGLPELIEAIRRTGRSDLELAVCGSGPLPPELRQLVDATPFCSLHHNLTDAQLAAEFAAADLFVLATRLRRKPTRSGEGFGLVLAEAQVAGAPVIAPAYGGGTDTFLPGITGVTPVDESSNALADAIERLVADRDRLAQMGQAAAAWARERFDPLRYAARAREMLL